MEWWQILVLTLYSGWVIFDDLGVYSGLNIPVAAGFITGLVMGDIGTGLLIGGSMQLMVLGIGTPGGASKIDAQSGAILGTAFAVSLNMNSSQALATIAVPVAALMVYTDILGRMSNTFFAHKIDSMVEKHNYKGIEGWFLAGVGAWTLSRMVPIFLALTFGSGVVEALVNVLNGGLKWLGDGLTLAGGALPAVGFAILLRFLPAKKHIAYLIIGFTLTTLLSTVFMNIQAVGGSIQDYAGAPLNGLPMLGIALLGGALAYINFKQNSTTQSTATQTMTAENTSTNFDDDFEGEIEDDEY